MVCVGVVRVKRRMYQRKVDVDMLNALKSVLADVSSVSPSSEQRHSLRRSAYPHQPYVDTYASLPHRKPEIFVYPVSTTTVTARVVYRAVVNIKIKMLIKVLIFDANQQN